ncbi:MAG: T9SS type A sorting domain-containing protein [Candidatus Sabulitectum sp.]|nr:T9SS type A sorting domain-containing protein [Candidatus Sabulitectum sp.]
MKTLSLALLILTCSLSADEWTIELLDSEGCTGYWSSIHMDSADQTHIVYRDDTANQLIHVFQNGTGWTSEVIATCDCWFISMVLDSSDKPHVSYWDNSTSEISYANWDGSCWVISVLETAGTSAYEYPRSDIELDSAGLPHVTWYDGIEGRLKYGSWTGSDWNIITVDSIGITGVDPSLSLDSNDNPHISYCNRTDSCLKYAFYNGSEWQQQTVDASGDVGGCTSIFLDGNDNPRISYYSWNPYESVKYALKDGSNWTIEVVYQTPHTYPGTPQGLTLDSQGNAHISASYSDYQNFLIYFQKGITGWTHEFVDGDYTGWDSSICTDTSDIPHIAYFDIYNEDLLYAKKDASGTFEEYSCPLQSFAFSIYPNPAYGASFVSITTNSFLSLELSVFDLSGRAIIPAMQIEVTASSNSTVLDGLVPGIYFCQVSDGNALSSQRFVILE